MANTFVLNVLRRLGVFDRGRGKTESAPPGRPRVLLFAREEVAAALTAALDAAGAEVVWSGADAGSAQAAPGARQTDVLVLDADLDFQAAVGLVRSAGASAVIFLEPRDPLVGELLADLRPAGFLARDPSVAQVSAVLAGARCAPTPGPARRAGGTPRWPLDAVAILLAAVAMALAFQLPGGAENLAAPWRPAVAAVAALAALSLAAQLRAGRPFVASVQAMLVALVASLPTHG